jgi:hypothetical protein
MSSLKLDESSELKDDVFVAIVKDCVEHKWGNDSTRPQREFSEEEEEKYRAIEKADTEVPKILEKLRGFWGGYAYLDDEPWMDDDLTGFIRLYSPMGSGKFGFSIREGLITIYHV